MRRLLATATALAATVSLGAPGAALAATSTTGFSASATVAASATVTASNLAFGSYTGTQLDATSSITVTATTGTEYSVGISAGSGAGATTTARRMTRSSGGDQLTYALYQDSGRTTIWGNTGASSVIGTGNGSAQILTVYGRIPANQSSPVGSYSDTLTVTVTY